jgi:hypothetical protein
MPADSPFRGGAFTARGRAEGAGYRYLGVEQNARLRGIRVCVLTRSLT